MARSDRENYELPDEYDFSGKEVVRGRFYSPKKKPVTIRLDDDVLVYFRKLAGIRKLGYQSLINAALRERMNQPLNESISRGLEDTPEKRGRYVR